MTNTTAIIGGGIGGLCLAQGLRKAGRDVTVYERDRTRMGFKSFLRLVQRVPSLKAKVFA
ncbi:NAD(P)-binding protein [Nonomuraea turkmeniaca]|uniref:NAD(P)-binding protein n=1 Tax=Nonomuraea turkmeniaca TaxID=103838 RepID=UPI001FEA64BC|nr:NAD(P)-binding protein [Nonomuraea turkmeniaca]